MRALLLLAAGFRLVVAQASTRVSSVALLHTITSTFVSTTSSVVSTSISTLTSSLCSTSSGTDGRATSTCKSSTALQPVVIYTQVVVSITTRIVSTSYSVIYASVSDSQISTRTQAQTTSRASSAVVADSSYVYTRQPTSLSSTNIAVTTSSSVSGLAKSSVSTRAVAATTAASGKSSNSSVAPQSRKAPRTSSGTIAAIVVVLLLAVALLGAAVFLVRRKQKQKSANVLHGQANLTSDVVKVKSNSTDRTTGAALGKTEMCSETTALTHEVPPTPSTPRDGFPGEVHERYEMSTAPARTYETDARPQYSPFPPRRGR